MSSYRVYRVMWSVINASAGHENISTRSPQHTVSVHCTWDPTSSIFHVGHVRYQMSGVANDYFNIGFDTETVSDIHRCISLTRCSPSGSTPRLLLIFAIVFHLLVAVRRNFTRSMWYFNGFKNELNILDRSVLTLCNIRPSRNPSAAIIIHMISMEIQCKIHFIFYTIIKIDLNIHIFIIRNIF
ncbi:unnamed protein product [Meganyctiphanes norvegica]|uniref:Uncharacterized protein n=1 Tax=Meganyctiphanes norvegica TaxID=48144 RepID=A0AAV2RIL2_MEGNR